LTQRVKERLS